MLLLDRCPLLVGYMNASGDGTAELHDVDERCYSTTTLRINGQLCHCNNFLSRGIVSAVS